MIYFMAALFAFLAAGIKFFKWHWLIAGYNTMSKKEQENVDAEGLGNFMGNWLFVLAGLLLLFELLPSFGNITFILFLAAFFLIIIYMIKGAQNYVKPEKKSDAMKKSDRVITNVIIGFIIFIGILVFGLIFVGSRDMRVEITDQSLRFSGMFGSAVSLTKITDIELRDEMPEVIRKVGGFDAGEVRRGRFQLEEMGTGTIFIHSSRQGPYIYIYHEDGFIIFQYKNPEQTLELYDYLTGELIPTET